MDCHTRYSTDEFAFDPQQYRRVLLALSWYYPEVHRGVALYAKKHRWHLTVDFDDPVPKNWDGDGVITHLGATGDQLWQLMQHLNVPIVDLTESRPQIPLTRVTMDNAAIGVLAAVYFLNRGFRHLAFFNRRELGVARRRRHYYTQSIRQSGLSCHSLSWEEEVGQRPDSRAARHEWLISRLRALPKPLGVFAVRDAEAAELVEACLASKLEIPTEVAVLGVDNSPTICECLSVPLSSIDSNLEQVGFKGAAVLDGLISGQAPPANPVYVAPVGVVERQSTDVLAVEHRGVARALRFIQESYSQPINVPDIARAVALSRSTLEKAFREYFVRAPGEELRRIRLERAKEMLHRTDEKIAAVASACGYGTPQNLCRTFKHKEGISPQQYRRLSRKVLAFL